MTESDITCDRGHDGTVAVFNAKHDGSSSTMSDLLVQGFAEAKSGDFASAIDSFSRLLDSKPDHWIALSNRAYCLLQIGSCSKSEEDSRNAISLCPDASLPYHLHGLALTAAGEFVDAATSFDQAIERDQSLTAARHSRAMTLTMLGEFSEAVAEFSVVVEMEPGNTESYAGRAFALAANGDLNAAEVDYKAAISVDPSNRDAWFHLAELQRATGKLNAAVESYSRCLDLSPDFNLAERARAECRLAIIQH